MKKMISLVSAAVMTASLLLPQTLAFSAAAQEDGDALIDAAYSENALTATGTENTLPYQLRFVPERNFVTAEEVAAGDVVIPASVYITGSTANTFGSAMVKYNAYHNGEKTGDVYFKDITTGDNAHKNSEKKTYNSSVGSFTTDQVPYCFGSLIGKNNTYTNNSPTPVTRSSALHSTAPAAARSHSLLRSIPAQKTVKTARQRRPRTSPVTSPLMQTATACTPTSISTRLLSRPSPRPHPFPGTIRIPRRANGCRTPAAA